MALTKLFISHQGIHFYNWYEPYSDDMFGSQTFHFKAAVIDNGEKAYLGSANSNLYTVQLNARDAVLSSCLTTAPPTCSGANPHLWASVEVEVGLPTSPLIVSIRGWSYYSV